MTTNSGAKILIIDDEPAIRKLLKVTLQAHQFAIIEASSGEEALYQSAVQPPDLIVLDLGLPDLPGMEVLRRLREWSSVPVIVLTAREREEDKIAALDAGADDYVTKPFGMGELLARIRVSLRHTAKSANEPVLYLGPLVMDLAQRSVELNGERLKLTPKEYDLLKLLGANAGKVLTHKQLLKEVWGGHQVEQDSHYLRVYIGHLRKKLEVDPTRPTLIVTEPGIGYRFMVPD